MKRSILLALALFAFAFVPAHANEHSAVTITTAAASKAICTLIAPGGVKVVATGTWGSGTLTLYETTDDGVTKLVINDLTGTASTLSAAREKTNTIEIFTARNRGKTKKIWGVLTGSTGATISAYCEDEKG